MHHCESSSCWDTTWWSGVIGSTFKYNGCKTVAHAEYSGYTWRAKHIQIWPRNTETERSSVNHIVDMINIVMFTNETTPSHVMIGCDRLYVQIQRVQNSCTRGILRLNLTSLAYTDMASEHRDRKVERESYSRYDQHSDVHHWNYSISRDDRTWFSWYGSRDHLED